MRWTEEDKRTFREKIEEVWDGKGGEGEMS